MIKLGRVQTPYMQDNLAGPSGCSRATIPLFLTDCISSFLKTLGFDPFDAELCIFKNEKTGVLVILYVDEMLTEADTDAEIEAVANERPRRKITRSSVWGSLISSYAVKFFVTRRTPRSSYPRRSS